MSKISESRHYYTISGVCSSWLDLATIVRELVNDGCRPLSYEFDATTNDCDLKRDRPFRIHVESLIDPGQAGEYYEDLRTRMLRKTLLRL